MNEQTLKGNWKQLKGKVRETWGKLTDDEVDTIGGSFDQLVGKVQEKYGYKLDEAKKNVNEFITNTNTKIGDAIDGKKDKDKH